MNVPSRVYVFCALPPLATPPRGLSGSPKFQSDRTLLRLGAGLDVSVKITRVLGAGSFGENTKLAVGGGEVVSGTVFVAEAASPRSFVTVNVTANDLATEPEKT